MGNGSRTPTPSTRGAHGLLIIILCAASACGSSPNTGGGGQGTAAGAANQSHGGGSGGGGASFGPEFTTTDEGGSNPQEDGGSTPDGSSDDGTDAVTNNQVVLSPVFQGDVSYFAFGAVAVGGSLGRTQQVVSVSDQSLDVTVGITGTNADEFALDTSDCGDPFTLAARTDSCGYSVTFEPTAEGSATATLEIDVVPGGKIEESLSGTGIGPSATTSGSSSGPP